MKRLVARAGALLLRHPTPIVAILLPLALMLGSLAGSALGASSIVDGPSYRDSRARSVLAQVRAIGGDYILAAGDSHIERWSDSQMCHLPIVNAGVSGATAASYQRFLTDLPLPRPPRAVVMTIGTNDSNAKRSSNTQAAVTRFRTTLQALLLNLRRQSPLVLVTSVPPLESHEVTGFYGDAPPRLSAVARAACEAGGCRFAEPFTGALRFVDGVHLRDYIDVYDRLEPQLCAMIAPAALQADKPPRQSD